MKKAILAIAIILGTSIYSQFSGEAYYKTTVNMHKNLPPGERGERMKSFMPEFMEFSNLLIFSSTESVYKNIESEEDKQVDFEEEQDRRRSFMRKRMAPPNDIVYSNNETSEIIEKKEFMDKIFLIRDTINSAKWKMTGEMTEMAGLNCMKAEHINEEGDDSTHIYVWFTPEVPIPFGPAGYSGLPGLIIYINENDGERIIGLDQIVMREVEEGEIEKPKKGKEVTREEFYEIKRKKIEEQRKQWEGQGGPGGGHGGGRHH